MISPTRRLEHVDPAASGLACLTMCAWLLGSRIDPLRLRAKFPNSADPSPRSLEKMASSIGLSGRLVRSELDGLVDLRLPAILRWGLDWYVVLDRMKAGRARIFHPAIGWTWVPAMRLDEKFSGIALEVSAPPGFTRSAERRPISAFKLLAWSPSTIRDTIRVLLLSALAQVFVIFGPLYGRLIVDDVIPQANRDLLFVLAIGFTMLVFFNAAATVLRELSLQHLSGVMSWDMTRHIFRRLLSLPLPWFEKRTTADIMQNVVSIETIAQFFSRYLTAIFVDGFMSAASLMMLVILSPRLAAVSLIVFTFYCVLRLLFVPLNKALQIRALDALVTDRGHRMDTIRAIQTIKTMASEHSREANWTTRFAENIQANLKSAAATSIFSTGQASMTALASIAILYIGAKLVLSGNMTVGLLLAAIAYETQFSSRAMSLLEQYVAWRMLDVHVARVADIVLTAPEPEIGQITTDLSPTDGSIEVENVSFRYSDDAPLILDRVSFRVEAGEHVAIMGSSGVGKSTLIKIMCGLYAPIAGVVRLNGRPISEWGAGTARGAIGVVIQNDQLLSGSIADNISFFDPQIDAKRLWECLAIAGIADEVARLPLREWTQVGEVGQAFSGGQRQRLFLARVLYKQPKLLILDEATSHLDVALEGRILTSLAELKTTVIIVAHRPETVARANRVLLLTESGIREAPNSV